MALSAYCKHSIIFAQLHGSFHRHETLSQAPNAVGKVDLRLMPAESTSAEAVECCFERRQRSAAGHTQICGAALSGVGH